jgi:hypothetical protein
VLLLIEECYATCSKDLHCSTLNMIERFWRHLKDQVCVDTLYPAMEQLIDSVVLELTYQNDPLYPERFTCSK